MASQSGFPLDQALLGFLMEGPAHGYALHDRAQVELGRVWSMGMSNVYGRLRELEKEGYLKSSFDTEGYPPRKVYGITRSGRRRFLAWVRRPVPAIRDMRVEFLAKLYFFHRLGLDGVGALVGIQKGACRQRLAQLEQESADRADAFERAVNDFRRRRIQASLDWLEGVRTTWT